MVAGRDERRDPGAEMMAVWCGVDWLGWRVCKTDQEVGESPDIGLCARANFKFGKQKKPFPYILCMGG